MPRFKHIPSGKEVQAHNAAQSSRYRRSSRFTELTDTDSHYHSPTPSLPVSSSSPQSPPESTLDTAHFTRYVRQQLGIEPTSPPDSPQIPTIAPETPSDSFDDLPLEHIDNHTVQQVLAWVANDPHRARQALDAETQGRNRVTLTSKLRRIR